MKFTSLIALAIAVVASAAAPSQDTDPAVQAKAPVQIISHKIGSDYYPMLDRPSLTQPQMSAENAEVPPTDNERIARQQQRNKNKNVPAPIAPEQIRLRNRVGSYTRVIDDAQLIQMVIKNTGGKPIKSVTWDFAFPRYENSHLLSRYDVTTNVEIKPGGKKTLKHTLPAGAKRCEVVRVVSDSIQLGQPGLPGLPGQPEKTDTFEAVCGKGFYDLSLLKQQRETISIKCIEYADGSVWQRQ